MATRVDRLLTLEVYEAPRFEWRLSYLICLLICSGQRDDLMQTSRADEQCNREKNGWSGNWPPVLLAHRDGEGTRRRWSYDIVTQ